MPLLVWARWGVPAVLIVALLGPKLCLGLLRTPHLKLHVVRGAVLMLSSLCFFAALKVLPLADATGLNYLTPVLVTVMAGWFLREQITWTRWMFVVVGFEGMLLILQPGSAMLQTAALFALGAAAFNATFQILTRKLAGEDLIACAGELVRLHRSVLQPTATALIDQLRGPLPFEAMNSPSKVSTVRG